MRVSLIQMDMAWGLAKENCLRAQRLIANAGASDLIVLPEMWATAFVMEPQRYADDADASPALAWMLSVAEERDCAVCGSLAVRVADGSYRNRHYFVTPAGISHYDKRHLFTHGHEHEHYVAGVSPVVVSWRGLRFLLQTCYDLRFPVFSRYGRRLSAGAVGASPSETVLEYDAIIYVANWPAGRQLAWDTLVRARAIENQCYVLAVNRVGDDAVSHYAGGSAVIDPVGRTLAAAPPEQACAASARIDPEKLLAMRSHFRVLADRDRF